MAQKKKVKKPRARRAQTREQILAEDWRTGFGKVFTTMRQVLRKAWMRGPIAYTIMLMAVEQEIRREQNSIMSLLAGTYPDMFKASDHRGEPADRPRSDPNCPIHGTQPNDTPNKSN